MQKTFISRACLARVRIDGGRQDRSRAGGLGEALRYAGSGRRRIPGVLTMLLSVLFSAWTCALEDEVTGPRLNLITDDLHTPGTRSQPAMQLDAHLDLRISGLLAHGTLSQRFRNEAGSWMEAEYLLPLPQDAAVTQLEIELDGRVIKGEIREREQARATYDAARRSGRRGALLEQQRPHLFTTRVANVPPGGEVSVRVELVIPVSYDQGEFSLQFPTTVTAPFVPGHPQEYEPANTDQSLKWIPLSGSGWAVATNLVSDAPLISAPQVSADGANNTISLDVVLNAGVPLADVQARYHDVIIERSGETFVMTLREGEAVMDRDLVLSWRPRSSALPQAAAFIDEFDGDYYGLIMVLPPVATLVTKPLPRELLLVLDVSGSMQGEPIRQAKESVLFALNTLGPADSFNVLLFNDDFKFLFPKARLATADTLAQARRFVARRKAGGGTQMLPALSAALSQPGARQHGEEEDAEPANLRQLIFITDGAVANEEELLAMIDEQTSNTRVFTVGIGSAPNTYLMRHAAELGRGSSVFIARPQEVAPKLRQLFTQIDQPMARDIEVEWPMEAEVFPSLIPDLYTGQPLLQTAKLSSPPEGLTLRVQGTVGHRHWENRLALPASTEAGEIARHWARRKLTQILTNGRGAPAPDSVRAAALPVALKYGLASPYTSFVAVESEIARPPEAQVKSAQVANIRPLGQEAQTFALAQGATPGLLKLYVGCFFAFIALITFAMNRPEPIPVEEC
ncbi:MAG: marine proteobacterial sortase target protein [Pseudomonadota bacterium]